jgi:phosphate-selective porin
MAMRIKESIRNAMLSAISAAADAGAGPATIELRTGAQPANADAAATGTLLATFTCEDPAFAAPSAGVMDLDAAPDLTTTAVAGGTAGWARVKDSTGATVFDGAVASSGSPEFSITSTTITNGQTVTLTVGSITQPIG